MGNHPCEKFPPGESTLHCNRRCSESSMAFEEEEESKSYYTKQAFYLFIYLSIYLSIQHLLRIIKSKPWGYTTTNSDSLSRSYKSIAGGKQGHPGRIVIFSRCYESIPNLISLSQLVFVI